MWSTQLMMRWSRNALTMYYMLNLITELAMEEGPAEPTYKYYDGMITKFDVVVDKLDECLREIWQMNFEG